MPSKTRTDPSWSDVKAKLVHLDRAGLVGLLGDLHNLSRDNEAFLNSRLGLGADPLAPYKTTIARWIYPDLSRNQDISVTKAKKAIVDYRKAIGMPEGVAECQRRSNCAAAFRSKSAAGTCKQDGPLEGAVLLAARYS